MKTLLRAVVWLFFLLGTMNGFGQVTCSISMQQHGGCAPYIILASAVDNSPFPITQRKWYVTTCSGASVFTSSPGTNPNFSYATNNAGCYCLRLWVQNSNGDTCSSQICNITVAIKPTINFTFSPTEGCEPLCVNAQCNINPGSGTVDSLVIDWGCGGQIVYTTCPATPIQHCFTNICPFGNVNPIVVAKNSFGCYADTVFNAAINLIPKPIARFTADTTIADCATSPMLVHFTADITDPNLTYSWYIGNTLVQSGASNLFTYSFPINTNCYDIKLKVSHPSGCTDSLVKVGYICVRTSPLITYTINDTVLCSPEALIMHNTSPGIPRLTYSLSGPQNFGPVFDSVATFYPTTAGNYTLTVTGTFAPGCTKTVTRNIVVYTRPRALFTVDDSFSCRTPFVVNLAATPCATCTYTWGVSNTVPSGYTGQNVQVTYNNFGSSTVRLVVTDNHGCKDTLNKIAYINIRHINPQITATGYKGCAPFCTTFKNATNLVGFGDSIASVCWSFPSSTIPGGCSDTLSRCISIPGCYAVQLKITTTTGCVDSILLNDTLCTANPPVCGLTLSKDTICYKTDSVKFSMSCDSFSYVNADFGDGSGVQTFFDQDFVHFYEDTGHLCAVIIAYKDSCASDTLRPCVQVQPPIAKFMDSSSCASKDTVYLISQTAGATNYTWYFCNGDSTFGPRPSVAFGYCATCQVKLDAYNSVTGCHHVYTKDVQTPCDSASFTPVNGQGCAPTQLLFQNTSPSSNPSVTRWDWDTSDGIQWNGVGSGPGNTIFHMFNTPGIYTVAMRNTTTAGCTDTAYATVRICNVTADFRFDTTCFPVPVCFHDMSVNYCVPAHYTWTFGDGTTDTVPNPCHVYPAPGTYTATLSVDNGVCSSSVTHQVVTGNIVALNYRIDTILCPGLQSCITNTSTGTALTYTWTMTGGSPPSSNLAAPCVTYNIPGEYTIYMHLSSGGQCTVDDSAHIHVHQPVAGGYLNTDYIACPNPPIIINYTDTSKYVDSLWRWDFGDGGASLQPDASHIYNYPGTYIVTKTVCDHQGCCNTATIDTVTVAGPSGQITEAPLPGICACKDSMTYTISSTNASVITLLYGCNLGFDTAAINPIGTNGNPTVVAITKPYCYTDSCQPQIIYGDTAGCKILYNAPFIYIDSPTVKFTFNNYGVCRSGTICFHDSTYYRLRPDQAFTVRRIWDFGDGTIDSLSNQSDPCHLFTGPGGYTVRLTIYSNLGCIDSGYTALVVVPDLPRSAYFADDSFVCSGHEICFHDTSYIYPLTGAMYRIWNFGDGSPTDTIPGTDICHTFNGAGFYRVSLCIFDSLGCYSCDSAIVMRVIANPVANITGDDTICYGEITQLLGTGGGTYQWSPSGLFSNPAAPNPAVQLTQDTVIWLAVANNYGCGDTDTVHIVLSRVFAAFTVPATICAHDQFCVTDGSTTLNGYLQTWQYAFGDGDTLTTANPCHRYVSPGNYTIEQTVINNQGCRNISYQPITVFSTPNAAYAISDTVICSNQQICFTDLTTSNTPVASWNWNYGDGTLVTGSNPPCHLFIAPYSNQYLSNLIVTDQNNCVDTAAITITMNIIPQADFSWTTSCEDQSMPLASTSLPGSSPVAACVWTFWLGAPNPVIDSSCYTTFQFPAGSHNVQLVVTDLNGCMDTIVKTVSTDSLSQLTIYPGDTIICLGQSVDYDVRGVFTRIVWTPNTWLSSPDSPIITINPLNSTGYVAQAINGVCGSVNDTFSIEVIQPIPIEVNATPQQIVLGLTSNITSTIPGLIDSITWSPENTLDCRDCPNPVASPLATTTYVATIYYTVDGVSCSNQARVTIDVLNSCNQSIVYVPNTFTPNGDGINDVFMIRGIDATKIMYFRVFDRWGKLVFEAQDGSPNDTRYGWDGTDRDGKKLNQAVYVYTYQIQCINGDIVAGQGNVTLVR